MKKITQDLWQTSLYQSGVLRSHAYYLQTKQGNVLLYNTGNQSDLKQMEALGGVDYQMLSHRDEAAPSLRDIRRRFNSQLVCSRAEVQAVEKNVDVDVVIEHEQSLCGINILETPGHTDGSLCFYYRSPHGGNYLFTGDTLFQNNHRWSTLVLTKAGGSQQALLRSLNKIKVLEPTLVFSSAFVEGEAIVELGQAEWQTTIEKLVCTESDVFTL